MIVERAEHPQWMSNAYLVADGDGGHGVLVDSNGVEEPLLEQIESRELTITHVLVTHHHADHVVDVSGLAKRFGVPVVGHALTAEAGVRLDETFADGDVLRSGALEIQVLATPGHCLDHHALLVNGTDCLTADCLFKGTVGGTGGGGPNGYADQVHSIMERLMSLPPETRDPSGPHAPFHDRRRVGAEPVHPDLARARPGGRRAVPRSRRGGDADPLGPGLRRHAQGLGALSRRPRRDRRRQSDRALTRSGVRGGRALPALVVAADQIRIDAARLGEVERQEVEPDDVHGRVLGRDELDVAAENLERGDRVVRALGRPALAFEHEATDCLVHG